MHLLSHLIDALGYSCLPLAAFLALFWVFTLRGERWRAAAVAAATCSGLYLALITELLSIPRWITRPAVALAWFVPAAVTCLYGWRLRRSRRVPEKIQEPLEVAEPLNSFDWCLLSGICLIVALVGLTAILAPPNTWDAMAYHMSRVAQWMTNRDVRPYPAFYSPQLFLSPWAEYGILHLDLLYGGDRLVNLVDWLSMAGTLVGVSLIAEQLGAGRRGQILAALVCATMPAGILEASGAMNTYASAFWLVAAVYYALRWNKEQSWAITGALAATISLAIFTKGTNYTFLPFVLLACWWLGSARARVLQLKRLAVIALAVLIVNGPLYVRNYKLSGSPLGFSSPLGDDPERQYANQHVSPAIAFANVVKNLALHVGTPVSSINAAFAKIIDSGLRHLGIDPNDKASTYRGGFHINPTSTYESVAGNPLQLALIFLTILLLLPARAGNRALRYFMAGICLSFVLFCALIRWQAWNGRYHLPLFALAAAVVGVVLERWRPRFLTVGVALLLLLSAAPFTLLNSLRPLAPWKRTSILRRPRAALYFADYHQTLQDSYTSAAQAVLRTGCGNIGVDASLEDFDYPMFALLGAGHGKRAVRYAEARNLTAAYARPEATRPCVIICLRCAHAPAKWAEYRSVGGQVSLFNEIAVFSANGSMPDDATFTSPSPAQIPGILDEIDSNRDRLRASHLGSVEEKVMRAAKDWPARQVELSGRIDSLYGQTYAAWRVRDSAYPLRRNHTAADAAAMDPLQVVAASQVLENWNQAMPAKIQELSRLVDQLYTSWQMVVAHSLPAGSVCRVEIQSAGRTDHNLQASTAGQRDLQTEDVACRCLGSHSEGTTVASKQLGKFDSEAESSTTCRVTRNANGSLSLEP